MIRKNLPNKRLQPSAWAYSPILQLGGSRVKSESAFDVRMRILGFGGTWRPIQHTAMKQTVQSLFGDWRQVQEVLMRPKTATAKAGNS
jgi:hypothetical protein